MSRPIRFEYPTQTHPLSRNICIVYLLYTQLRPIRLTTYGAMLSLLGTHKGTKVLHIYGDGLDTKKKQTTKKHTKLLHNFSDGRPIRFLKPGQFCLSVCVLSWVSHKRQLLAFVTLYIYMMVHSENTFSPYTSIVVGALCGVVCGVCAKNRLFVRRAAMVRCIRAHCTICAQIFLRLLRYITIRSAGMATIFKLYHLVTQHSLLHLCTLLFAL